MDSSNHDVGVTGTVFTDDYKMCADTCQELGVLEGEMHQTVREKFIDPKEKFLKQDLKDGAFRVVPIRAAAVCLNGLARSRLGRYSGTAVGGG